MLDLQWDVIFRYREDIVSGLVLALRMTAAGFVLGAAFGLLLAFARTSGRRWLSGPATVYVEFVRNIPLLLIVLIFYFGVPMVVPRASPRWVKDILILDGEASMIVALALYYGAYLCEVFRAGILSVGRRYLDAGRSLGLTGVGIARWITLPIMFRAVLPSLSNTSISLFKDTSIAMAISVPELTFAARKIATDTFKFIEPWVVVGGIYLVTAWLIAFVLRWLERRIRWTA